MPRIIRGSGSPLQDSCRSLRQIGDGEGSAISNEADETVEIDDAPEPVRFDPGAAQERLQKLWQLPAEFGVERSSNHVYLNEIVSDRYALVNGLQMLRDELQLATGAKTDVHACAANFALPSVITTLAKTNCGDRIHQGHAADTYVHLVASRFATLSEIGELKVEAFSPTGGGTEDGATLAHTTIAHQIDETIRGRLYNGNPQSFVLAGLDLQTHVGRIEDEQGGAIHFGRARESPYREPRAACGAIVGALTKFNEKSGVHRRIRRDLGEANFAHLATNALKTVEGIDITFVVAAAIVAIQGMQNTLDALAHEMDVRGLGHVTACLTVNRVSRDDMLIFLSRGTAFYGKIRIQGLGTDATKYGGRIIERRGDKRLVLTYDGIEPTAHQIVYTTKYRTSTRMHAPAGVIDI